MLSRFALKIHFHKTWLLQNMFEVVELVIIQYARTQYDLIFGRNKKQDFQQSVSKALVHPEQVILR